MLFWPSVAPTNSVSHLLYLLPSSWFSLLGLCAGCAAHHACSLSPILASDHTPNVL